MERTTYRTMDDQRPYYSPAPFEDGLTALWRKGVRLARNLAIAGALAGVSGLVLGAVLTDGWLAQIFVTLFAAFVLWLPMLGLTIWASRLSGRRRPATPATVEAVARPADTRLAASWHRLGLAADLDRLAVLAVLAADPAGLGRSAPAVGPADLAA